MFIQEKQEYEFVFQARKFHPSGEFSAGPD